MARFEFLIETQPRQRRRAGGRARGTGIPSEVIASEWRPAPLGRFGRRLWRDIDRYLEFLAIVEDRPDHGSARRTGTSINGAKRRGSGGSVRPGSSY
jgi:hypothetical protein